jgi:hypothetical protein
MDQVARRIHDAIARPAHRNQISGLGFRIVGMRIKTAKIKLWLGDGGDQTRGRQRGRNDLQRPSTAQGLAAGNGTTSDDERQRRQRKEYDRGTNIADSRDTAMSRAAGTRNQGRATDAILIFGAATPLGGESWTFPLLPRCENPCRGAGTYGGDSEQDVECRP